MPEKPPFNSITPTINPLDERRLAKYIRENTYGRDIFSDKQAGDFNQYYRYQSLYDSFVRADSTNLGQTEDRDRRAWSEDIGNLEISGNALRAVSLTSSEAIATMHLGYQEYVEIWYVVQVNAASASAEGAVVFRVAGGNDLLLAQVVDADVVAANGALRLFKRVAGTYTLLDSIAFGAALTADTRFLIHVVATGPVVIVEALHIDSAVVTQQARLHYDGADTWTPILQTGQRIGCRFTRTATDPADSISARTW